MHAFIPSSDKRLSPRSKSASQAMFKAFAIAYKRLYDLGVLLACQVEAALLLGQLGNSPQHAFPLLGFCSLPRGHGFCHGLQDMQLQTFHISVPIKVCTLQHAPACIGL